MQPLFEHAQLRVVERTGNLLAIARDERHRRAAIEQLHGRLDLLLTDAELFRDLSIDICHAKPFSRPAAAVNRRRRRTPLMDHHRLIHQPAAGNKIDLWIALIEQFNTCGQPVAMTQYKGGSMAL